MARYKKNGLMAGTLINNLIFYERGGKQYIRTMPDKVRQPNTPAQRDARERFRLAAGLARRITGIGIPVGPETLTEDTANHYQRTLGLIRRTGFVLRDGKTEWDWNALQISNGTLPDPVITTTMHPDGTCTHTWDASILKHPEAQVFVIGLVPHNLDVWHSKAPVSKGTLTWTPDPGALLFALIAHPQGQGWRVSRSVLVGEAVPFAAT